MRSRLRALLQMLARWDRIVSQRIAGVDTTVQPNKWSHRAAWLGAHMGDSVLWIAITGFLLWRTNHLSAQEQRPRITTILSWFTSMMLAGTLTLWLKTQIQRTRPTGNARKLNGLYGGGPDAHSFPSGHATRLGAIVAWSDYLTPGGKPLYTMLALWVGWSRIRLGVHYLGDILCGYAIGYTVSTLIKWLTVRRES